MSRQVCDRFDSIRWSRQGILAGICMWMGWCFPCDRLLGQEVESVRDEVVRRSGADTKWTELSSLLGEIFTPAGLSETHRAEEPAAPYGSGQIPPPKPS
ncbi:MAG: hypothetical protein ACKN9U_08830, partial [Pirellulaceae bacterium]